MPQVQLYVSTYAGVMADYMLAGDGMAREMALSEATEVGKQVLRAGPAVDLMFELHRRAQQALAGRWSAADATAAERAARERLVEGEAIQLLLSLMLPHDIEQRAHHERRWRRDHAKLSAMFEQTDSLMVIFDNEGQIDDVNPAFVRVTGWTALQAALGQVPAWRTPLPLHGTQHCTGEQLRSDGSAYRAEWSVSPILGSDGQLINHVCIGRDVTRQQQIDDSLRDNDKLRAVAILAAVIAHDFNNLLGAIIGLTELCQAEAVAGSRQLRNLGRVHEAGHKAAALVRQMLDFSRQTPKAAQRMRMSELLAHADALLRAAVTVGVRFEARIDQDGPVCVDPVQLEQALLNLCRNAAHAMAGRPGALTLVLDRADPTEARPPDGSQAARHMRLRVSDTGAGMPREVIKRIFEPFFTTKPVGEGTGLGLSAVHGIVTSHGGVIEVESTPGVGSTFSVFLPLDDGPLPDAEPSPQVAAAAAEKPAMYAQAARLS
jgi:signal transduction histidine kinase